MKRNVYQRARRARIMGSFTRIIVQADHLVAELWRRFVEFDKKRGNDRKVGPIDPDATGWKSFKKRSRA